MVKFNKNNINRKNFSKRIYFFSIFIFLFDIINFIGFIIPCFLTFLILVAGGSKTGLPLAWQAEAIIYYTIVALILFVPLNIWFRIAKFCITIRRLHDFNCPGIVYFVYLLFMFIINLYLHNFKVLQFSYILSFIVFFVIAGVRGSNTHNNYNKNTPFF